MAGSLFQTLLADGERVLESELPSSQQLRAGFTALVHRLEAELPQLAEVAYEDVLGKIGAEPPRPTPAQQPPIVQPDAPIESEPAPAAGAPSPVEPAPAAAGEAPPTVAAPIGTPAPAPVPAEAQPAAIAAAAVGAEVPGPVPAQPDAPDENKTLAELDAEAADLEQRLAQLRSQRDAAAQAGIGVSTTEPVQPLSPSEQAAVDAAAADSPAPDAAPIVSEPAAPASSDAPAEGGASS